MKLITTERTWLKDFPHEDAGLCDNASLVGDGLEIPVSHTLEAQGHIYFVRSSEMPTGENWVYKNHCKIEGTEQGNDPKSTPNNSEELPPTPKPEFKFYVPGISAELTPSSPIWHKGAATNFTWGEAVIGSVDGSFREPVDTSITQNIIRMAGYMQTVRDFLGNRPIGVTSWYRDPETNRKWGGASRSYHMTGKAVDFYVIGENVVTTFNKLKSFADGGLAVGDGFVHIDLGALGRWSYPNGPKVSLW